MASSTKPVHVVGGGLAGSEAAWQLAQAGVPIVTGETYELSFDALSSPRPVTVE